MYRAVRNFRGTTKSFKIRFLRLNFCELGRLSQLKCKETTFMIIFTRTESFSWNSRKFSAAKISDYTVYIVIMYVGVAELVGAQ